jgi:hypothetical protein
MVCCVVREAVSQSDDGHGTSGCDKRREGGRWSIGVLMLWLSGTVDPGPRVL